MGKRDRVDRPKGKVIAEPIKDISSLFQEHFKDISKYSVSILKGLIGVLFRMGRWCG
jgi:hypothetical protein